MTEEPEKRGDLRFAISVAPEPRFAATIDFDLMGKEFSTAATSNRLASVPFGGLLQRRCACGNHMIDGGECADCGKRKNGLQRKVNNQKLPGNGFFQARKSILQPKLAIGASNDPLDLFLSRGGLSYDDHIF